MITLLFITLTAAQPPASTGGDGGLEEPNTIINGNETIPPGPPSPLEPNNITAELPLLKADLEPAASSSDATSRRPVNATVPQQPPGDIDDGSKTTSEGDERAKLVDWVPRSLLAAPACHSLTDLLRFPSTTH